MNQPATLNQPADAFSVARLLKVLVPILAVALAVRYLLPSFEQAAQQEFEQNMLAKLLGPTEVASEQVAFKDVDGDLLCDFPADDQCVTPETLVFSYVGPPEESDEATSWADVLTALSDATGLPVEYQHYPSTSDQVAALADAKLHIVGLNTGAIPLAVETAGFHPVCTFGREDGSFGYTMKLLTRAEDGVDDPAKLAGKRIAFTTPDSNSGCKAALVYLMNQQDLLPERDYQWGFTFGHETSVKELLAGEHDAAPVASDILERMTNDGEVDADALQVIYESERFPPATIGYAYNLSPELREEISKTLLGFVWPGTSVEAKYGASGATQFVPVNYKDDWANIRRINATVESKKK
ncbi:ABC transporter, phosphonate, periplasmic substrate-binding protein [Botrimarina colliarenosi]|uniref:ABC transporter, phosphonate, periplasmic substrate-binding protein n=1 Tax=Botrimarina colliarenosi TaxID=2528001 RepID=A0A5C6A9X9_9BACT|nr:phosphate/phosphite/phosphonate ABC transporter substrate-binding protein [Botrimarina colliarenosi]TWT96210.1 ABC transporter, phosphonate, periplasmic substrate-binding protein [Botrimarina colliarenosi]